MSLRVIVPHYDPSSPTGSSGYKGYNNPFRGEANQGTRGVYARSSNNPSSTQAGSSSSLSPQPGAAAQPNPEMQKRAVERAYRQLKKLLQQNGVMRELKARRYFEKPSKKKAREKSTALRRIRRLQEKAKAREE